MKKNIAKTKRGKTMPSTGKCLVGAGGLLNIAAVLKKQVEKTDEILFWNDRSKGAAALAQKEDGDIDDGWLIRVIQIQREAGVLNADICLAMIYGQANHLAEAVVDNDPTIQELSAKMVVICKREGLGDDDYFDLASPKTPKDWLTLNAKYDQRLDEIISGVMRGYGENETADLYLKDRKTFYARVIEGLKILNKDDPEWLEDVQKLRNQNEEVGAIPS